MIKLSSIKFLSRTHLELMNKKFENTNIATIILKLNILKILN